jgi:hypothetical protein
MMTSWLGKYTFNENLKRREREIERGERREERAKSREQRAESRERREERKRKERASEREIEKFVHSYMKKMESKERERETG